jgi:hypothetical protein
MIDEYEKNYWLLSCDVCGITEVGPFETFNDAVQYKRDNPDEWKSIRKYDSDREKKKTNYWQDVCAGCFPETVLGKWKSMPVSKRKARPEIKVDENLTNMANSIAKTINKRKREL